MKGSVKRRKRTQPTHRRKNTRKDAKSGARGEAFRIPNYAVAARRSRNRLYGKSGPPAQKCAPQAHVSRGAWDGSEAPEQQPSTSSNRHTRCRAVAAASRASCQLRGQTRLRALNVNWRNDFT